MTEEEIRDRLAQIRERERAATPGEWSWEDGWQDVDGGCQDDFDADEETGGEKYLNLGLVNQETTVLGLSVDHYEPHWDVDRSLETPGKSDRDFIANSRADIPWLLELVANLQSKLEAK